MISWAKSTSLSNYSRQLLLGRGINFLLIKPSVCEEIIQVYPAQDILRSAASQENDISRLNIEFLTFLAKTYGLLFTNRFQYIIYWQC